MDICTDLTNIKKFEQSNLTIGSFDGMHQGHMKIINELKRISQNQHIPTVVVTFDPHPQEILNKNIDDWEVLTTNEQKIEIFNDIGIDYAWVIPFSDNFAKVTAKMFLKNYLIKYFNPLEIVIGYDHHFGYKRRGDANFLNSMKRIYNYKIREINPLIINNIPVSSTIIRNYIKTSNIKSANNLLDRKYSLLGKVVKGKGIGQGIGFPTANIESYNPSQLIPSRGVYCVDVIVNNKNYIGMCNIGNRPTIHDEGEDVIEVHLITDNNLSIYGEDILIKFKDFIRKEKKYKNTTELVNQLRNDRYTCMPN
jgi:riboflavin kinase/FMN adenylyltransferase